MLLVLTQMTSLEAEVSRLSASLAAAAVEARSLKAMNNALERVSGMYLSETTAVIQACKLPQQQRTWQRGLSVISCCGCRGTFW
jgi:hypothetical protein